MSYALTICSGDLARRPPERPCQMSQAILRSSPRVGVRVDVVMKAMLTKTADCCHNGHQLVGRDIKFARLKDGLVHGMKGDFCLCSVMNEWRAVGSTSGKG